MMNQAEKLKRAEVAAEAAIVEKIQTVHHDVLDANHLPIIDLHVVSNCLTKGDAGYCDIISAMYPDCILYDNSSESFYVWNGCHWQQNATGSLKNLLIRKMSSVIEYQFNNICEQVESQESKTIAMMELALRDEDVILDSRIKDRGKKMQEALFNLPTETSTETTSTEKFKIEYDELKRIRGIRSRFYAGKKIKHELILQQQNSSQIMAWAKSQFGIDGSEWDQCTDALPVANGIIDLSTGKLKPTTPGMMIKTYSDIEYRDINESCSNWERAFNQIMYGNDDKKLYLQKLFGMSLLGRQLEHVFPILYGKDGRNGKDLLTGTITKILGPMASKVHKTVILKPKRGVNDTGLSPQLMQLKGLRFAYVNETEQGDIIDQAQLKELTGGGYISARGMRENMQRFSPSYILFLTTNTKPHIRANDRAIWERTRVIELLADFQDNPNPDEPNQFKKDTQLDDKLEPELSGILSWLVRGCMEYLNNGIDTPQSVMDTTSKYREDEDTVGKFVRECCYVADDAKCKATELYKIYSSWCDENGIKAMNSEALGKILNDKGFEKKRSNGWKFFGIAILSIIEVSQ